MRWRVKLSIGLCAAITTVLMVGTVAVAVGLDLPMVTSPGSATATPQLVDPTSDQVSANFSAFRAAPNVSDVSGQNALRNEFGSGGVGHMAANADFSDAKPSPVSGSGDRAWIAPSGDQVCVFLPDPTDGYATTCATPDDVKAGRGVLVLSPPAQGEQLVHIAVIVADGGPAPVLTSDSGAKRTLVPTNNVASTVAPPTGRLTTDAGVIDLAATAQLGAK